MDNSRFKFSSSDLNEVIPLCIYIFTLLLYITVNTTTIEYNANATCFDVQRHLQAKLRTVNALQGGCAHLGSHMAYSVFAVVFLRT